MTQIMMAPVRHVTSGSELRKLNRVYNIFYILEVKMPWFNYNFTIALCECESWSLTLRQERRPRVFDGAQDI
jgi:hypothetical protein